MEIDRSKISPMMQQYFEVKDKYTDCILFFRLGDFYEMFFDDAVTVSKALELTLTGRDCGLEERAPMCGVPYHAADMYIKKLIDLGFKVAVCEQLTDPAETKGIVVRDVIRVVTPGTLTESSMLDDGSNNYICSIFYDKDTDSCGVASADISTGDAALSLFEGKDLEAGVINELSRCRPAEIIFPENFLSLKNAADFVKVRLSCAVTLRDTICFTPSARRDTVTAVFGVKSVTELGISEDGADCAAVCGLFDYINDTQKTSVSRFTAIDILSGDQFMGLDLNARRNLELTETLRSKEKKGSLLWVLDSTKTSMGRRLLKNWIEQPLKSPARIIERLDAVEALYRKSVVLADLTDLLDRVYDLERLMTKVMYKSANPRDLKSLSATAMQLPLIKQELAKLSDSKLLARYNDEISTLDELVNLVENAIMDEPPISVKDGGVIKEGFNKELDSLRHIMNNGRSIIDEIEQREKEATGIKNLKIGFNRVFGYYLEVTRSYYDLIPEGWIRKQTLANAERFITEELKNAENAILGAKDKALALEADIFSEVRDFLATKLEAVQKTASAVASVDVLCSFADVALRNQYVKPDIVLDGAIDIKAGRHPVVELMLTDEVFVPNDLHIDNKSDRMSIITGPNMSGKSTYMRQNALIVLMAQIGSFVPADSARISVVDKIFTRVGASDDLTAGQSTFMVEMSEVSDILKNATKDSLVILDEVGRGTSTFDGVSIARAVAEHICTSKKLGCKTLFATHYHELIGLENELEGVKNYSIAVNKHGGTIRFLRKIVRGGVDESYGVDVAKLAGLPAKVVSRARELLEEMEKAHENERTVIKNDDFGQISFGSLGREAALDMLEKTNIDELSDSECRELLKDMLKAMQ
ncbi:DNA mismatch repair protein MutS [Ruminococcus flavefaciens]|uniref:DNA mismatch repair protein MutS n=1 Tax=Ruminococcus flavefaciens TaxID=1265 RepID=A0A1H6IGB3_RUMFL|nr:DNA mismatch repair protein MutS [Ruminococcus flavefaciens]SEH45949.1 DNA mismatch repair protein MutS [Ruminococcus flavefaciens]